MRKLLGIVLAAAAAGCKESAQRATVAAKTPTALASPTVPPRLQILDSAPTVEALRKADLDQALDGFEAIVRLKPDRRFLIAIDEARRILSGPRPGLVRLEFRDGRWEIFADSGEVVGNIPEIPSFFEAFSVLTAWGVRLRGQTRDTSGSPNEASKNEIRAGAERFLVPSLADSLGRIDEKWTRGARDPDLLTLAGHDLVLLNLQTLDRLDMADLLSGRALAALSLAEAFGSAEPVEDKALLAAVMGYGTDARRLAERLSPTDPVRLFVLGKTAELRARAERLPQDRETQYLALRALADTERRDAWTGWLGQHFFEKQMSLSVLHAGLRIPEFGSNPVFADAILYAWMAELAPRESGVELEEELRGPRGPTDELLGFYLEAIRRALAVKPSGLIRGFETALRSRSDRINGVFWDGDAYRAFARASFYSALHALGISYLDQLSSGPASLQFADYLSDAPQGAGGQFARWYRHLAQFKSGGGSFQDGFSDLSDCDLLGSAALERTLQNLRNSLFWKPDALFDVVSRLARRLDTRVRHQWTLAQSLFTDQHDFRRTEKLCRGISRLSPEDLPWERAWCGNFVGDTRDLLALAADRRKGIEVRSAALHYLRFDPKTPRESVRSLDRRLLEESGYDRAVVGPYIDYLEDELKDYGRAREATEAWLSRHRDEDSLVHTIYVGRRAHLLDLEGRHAEAWLAIEPVIASWQGAVMGWAARILENLRRHEEAVNLARKAVDRYPDSGEARGDLAELLWRGDRFSDAADIVGGQSHRPELPVWERSISKNFFRAFQDRSPDDSLKAFDALVAQRPGVWSLQTVIAEFAQQKRFELAFRLEGRMLQGRGDDYFVYRVNAYQYLKGWKGEEEGLSWLRAQLDEKRVEPGMPVFFEMKEDGLLWDLYPDPRRHWSSSTWLLRACAAALRGFEASPHREELLAHYRGADTADLDDRLGRHVLNLEGYDTVRLGPLSEEDKGLAAFVMGVRAVGDGDYRTGSDWLLLATMLTRSAGRASMLAMPILGRWYSEGKALGLAAQKKLW